MKIQFIFTIIWPIIVTIIAIRFFENKPYDPSGLHTIMREGILSDEFSRDSFKGIESQTILRMFGEPTIRESKNLSELSCMPQETFFAKSLYAYRFVKPDIEVELWTYDKPTAKNKSYFVVDVNGESEVLASTQGEPPYPD